jgi:Zn-finger nucleic acid-binding protein
MQAETLNCPMCGAAASSDSTKCEHCNARLATVSCPSCFGMIFQGSKFCSHCGARADRTEVDDGKPKRCPRCNLEMNAIVIGDSSLKECSRCEGLWADIRTLKEICTDRAKQSAVLGAAMTLEEPATGKLEQVRYVPCPTCRQFMNRVHFANCSHVIVDVCKGHGTWFDKDELRRIVEFIRAGGFDKARAREIQDLEEKRRQLQAEQTSALSDTTLRGGYHYSDNYLGVSLAAAMLDSLLD